MKHLKEIKDFENLLNGPIEISQKVDGSALIVKFINNKIRFYNRESRKEIDKVEQIAFPFYDEAIDFLKEKLKNILTKENQELHFEYFSTFIKPIIKIINKPKNNLILLYSNLNSPLEKIANKIDVDITPTIFKGILSKEQKELILNNLITPEIIKKLNNNFKPLINPNEIEGIVIKNLKTNELYKITNELFTSIIKLKKEENKDLQEYKKKINQLVFDFDIKISNNYKYSEENFLNLIFENLIEQQNKILSQNNKFFESLILPDKSFFPTLNLNYIPKELKNNLLKYNWFSDFVRSILTNYRTIKKRSLHGTNKDSLKIFNSKVEQILRESKLTFKQFLILN